MQQRLGRLDSPAAMADVALESAYAVLSDGVPLSHEEMLDQLRGTDPQLVDHAARELESTLLVGLPENAKLARGLKLVSFPEAEPSAREAGSPVNWPDRPLDFLGGQRARRGGQRPGGPLHAHRRRGRALRLA